MEIGSEYWKCEENLNSNNINFWNNRNSTNKLYRNILWNEFKRSR